MVRRSHRTAIEKALGVVFLFPFRCNGYNRRFYRFRFRNTNLDVKSPPQNCPRAPILNTLPVPIGEFFDHYLPLTELSVAELMSLSGFEIERSVARFLPYTMSLGYQPAVWKVPPLPEVSFCVEVLRAPNS